MTVKMIFAYDLLKGVGFENRLPWHIPSELQHFKKETTGFDLLMGRKTFESLPNLLKGRTHFVLSSQQKKDTEQVKYIDSAEVRRFQSNVAIIGGISLFYEFKDLVDEFVISEIQSIYKSDIFIGDDFFNDLIITHENVEKCEKSGIYFIVKRYRRI